ncbi:CHAT domain-containing protein [Streptomyces sp. NPDC059382]|uniref:CHAT domain-containing protein n=1 Tax=Streptomyces sp. NPDC059382 TaxID=3346816 RepID=UPI0036B300C2
MGGDLWHESKAMAKEVESWRTRIRAEALFDVRLLDEAVATAAALLDHSAASHPRRPFRLAMTAELLVLRFEWAGRAPHDLELARQLARESLSALPGELRLLPYVVTMSAQAHYIYGNTHDDATTLRETLDILDTPHPPSTLADAEQGVFDAQQESIRGLALLSLFQLTGEADLLERSVAHARAAIARFPAPGALAVDSGPSGAVLRVNLGNTLRVRHYNSGGKDDLEESYAALTRALTEFPTKHAGVAVAHGDLGGTLQAAFAMDGDLSHLESAVDQFRKALAATRPQDTRLAMRRANLALALLMLFDYTGGQASLHEAIPLARLAAGADSGDEPPSPQQASFCTTALSEALVRRGALLNDPADYTESVNLARAAAGSLSDEHPELPGLLETLSGVLRARHDAFGDPADLEEAITSAHRSLSLPLPYVHDGARQFSTLGRLLTGGARRVASNAPEPVNDGAPRPPGDNGGGATADGVPAVRKRADMDEGIDLLRKALAACTPGRLDEMMHVFTLSEALGARFDLFGAPGDLTEALALSGGAALNEGSGDHDRLAALSLHALNLLRKSEHGGSTQDLRQAMALWKIVAGSSLIAPESRVADARRLAVAAARLGEWSTATDAYAQAIRLLPRLVWHGTGWAGRENALGKLAGLASDAAACAVAAGDPVRALTLLEQGRSVLWRQVLDLRADLAGLRAEEPDLARALEETRRAMLSNGMPERSLPRPQTSDGIGPDGAGLDRHMVLARRWDELVARVRELPGHSGFLRVPPFTGIPQDAPDLAVLNVSVHGCHALLVRGGTVRALPLAVTLTEVYHQATEFLDAVDDAEPGQGPGGDLPADRANDVLAWLYERVAGPVLDALGAPERAAVDPGRRIVWCPTGPLTFLPIHAAGLHTTCGQAAPSTVLDRVLSSYTPTVRDLTAAGGAVAPRRFPVTGEGFLVVDIPKAAGAPELPGAEAEAALLRSRFPSALRLSGRKAGRVAVLEALERCSWVHFACHGSQDPDDPSAAGLVLDGEMISLADLSRARQAASHLAFLSACDTFRGGGLVSDESLTLATGLRTAGWRDVVGALYPADDHVSARIVGAVYERLAQGCPPYEALHEAVLPWRDLLPTTPKLWAHFVHIGP